MSEVEDVRTQDEDLLEFLGGIDEVNEESGDADFSDFLADSEPDPADTGKPAGRREPAAEEKK